MSNPPTYDELWCYASRLEAARDIAAKAFRAETVLSLLWSEGVCLFEGEDWDWEGAAWAALQEACREWDAWEKGEKA